MHIICFTVDSTIPLECGISGELDSIWIRIYRTVLSSFGRQIQGLHHLQLLECHITWSVSLSVWLCDLMIFLESINHSVNNPWRNNPCRPGIFFHPVSWYRGQYVGMGILALVLWLVSPCYFSQNICHTVSTSYNIPEVCSRPEDCVKSASHVAISYWMACVCIFLHVISHCSRYKDSVCKNTRSSFVDR